VDDEAVPNPPSSAGVPGRDDGGATFPGALSRREVDRLLAPLTDVVLAVDAAECITYASPSLDALLGYAPDDVVGRPLAALLDGESLAPEVLAQAQREAGVRIQARHRSGEPRDVVVRAHAPDLAVGDDVTVVLRDAADRRPIFDALRQRLAFEDLLTRLAATLLRRPAHEVSASVDAALSEVGEFVRVDRAWLYQLSDDRGTIELSNHWAAPGVVSKAPEVPVVAQQEISEWLIVMRQREEVYCTGVSDLPAGMRAGLDVLEPAGTASVLAVPVADGPRLIGFLGFSTARDQRVWSDDAVSVLHTLAGLVAQAVARADAEERLGLAFDHAPLGMALHGADGRHLQVNAAYAELVGRSVDEIVGRRGVFLVADEDQGALVDTYARMAEGVLDRAVVELRLDRPDGRLGWVRVHIAAVRARDRSLRYTVSHVEDVTERHLREAELRSSEERYRTLVENSPSVVMRFGPDLKAVYVSPALEQIAGLTPDHVVNRGAELFTLGEEGPRWEQALRTVFDTGRRLEREWELSVNGRRYWFQSRAVPEFRGDGTVEHVLVMNTDITAVKRSEAELAHQALHDPLTGLANRTLLRDHLEGALARTRRRPATLAVLFLDLDRFKLVNDSLGHDAGDHLLVEVAARLSHLVRDGDTVARLGGDEFVILVEDLHSPDEPVHLATRIREAFHRPVTIGGNEVFTSASIGIAVARRGSDADGLLRDADAAMYLAKARGRDRYELFDEGLRSEATEKLQMENTLRRSLEMGGLHVHYQPEVDLATGRAVGMEALARWEHPTLGLLDAGVFIGLAEETGLIVDVGTWVLHEACQRAGTWRHERADHPMTMRVNLSARQLVQPDLVEVVVGALERASLPPSSLCLEITETALMDDPDLALKVLSDLHALGVHLAIDDFGTGYSSLAYLKRFPVDVLKIDRSFVDGLGVEPEDTAIVTAIISLARALGLTVVAEGVETPRQLDELRRLDCDHAQGFLFSRAVASAQFWDVVDGLTPVEPARESRGAAGTSSTA
jgi:diguanylate cyclase (GGDEF)-like protein/PAS domain S-box-containing protein